jgi:hypothetical protein
MLAVVDQLNDISVVEAAESVDYADVQEEYLSYFINDKVALKYEGKLLALPTEIQSRLLKTFEI